MRSIALVAALAMVAGAAACGQGVRAADGDLPAGDVRVVEGQQPLACGRAPLSALSEEPGAEKADTAEAQALRGILATGIAGMSFPPEDDWVVLHRADDEVVYGHREGTLGIGHVVTVRRTVDGWGFGGSGGCGPLGWADGRRAGHTDWYTEHDGGIELEWMGGACDEPVDPVVQVVETSTTVSLVFVPPSRRPVDCSDVGVPRQTAVPLEAPVGDRVVENAGYLPVRVVPSRQEHERAQAAEAAAIEQSSR